MGGAHTHTHKHTLPNFITGLPEGSASVQEKVHLRLETSPSRQQQVEYFSQSSHLLALELYTFPP